MSGTEQARADDRAVLEDRAQRLYEACVARRTDARQAARRIANAVLDELEFIGPSMRAAGATRRRDPKTGRFTG